MEEWFQRAVDNPWPFIALVLAYGIWRGGKTLFERLFDDDGIITQFMEGIREDSAETKAGMVQAAQIHSKGLAEFKVDVIKILSGNSTAIERLESQLVTAIQAKASDSDLHRALFTESPIPICYVESGGKFLMVNEACSAFLGYSMGELSNLKFQEITEGEDLAGDIDNVQRVEVGTLTKYRMSKRYIHKDGRKLPADLYVFRYPEIGPFLHFISIIIPK